jgi:uncharacterized protein (TIGR02145 family)
MKRSSIFLAMALAVCVVATTSCEKDKDETPSLSINPSQTEVKFKADGTADGNAAFAVVTNQATWDAKPDKTWVTVTKTTTGFTLSAAPNTATTAPEAAKVTVSAGTATAVVLTVTQAAAAPSLSLTPAGQTAIAFAADGTTGDNAAFTVATNLATWDAVSDKAWVTVNKTATGFTVSAAPNTSYVNTPEAATVTVSATGVSDIVINVTQTVKPVPADGVLINGVVWAKYNVDASGAFADTPEAQGKFYQWNTSVAWATTGDVSNWPTDNPVGSSWEAANDPSPEGWRVPTIAELLSLADATQVDNVWVNQNGVNGRKFTDKTTGATIFLPAISYINYSNGELYTGRTYYWSSTEADATRSYSLFIERDSSAARYFLYRASGLSVRSVAK